MPKNAQAIPKGYHTVTPSLFVAGAARAIAFYKKALGAEELSRVPAPDGPLMHAEIQVGGSRLMLGDEMPEQGGKRPKSRRGTAVGCFLHQENVEAASTRAIDARGGEVMPLEDQFGGARAGCFEDPFGHTRWLAQHIRDMTPEELTKAGEAYFSQMQPAP